jgi:hypothetical protein
MKYNYIFMSEIEANDKINIAKTLKDCTDIELFEQSAIQHIIDYKWDTYAQEFFLQKFYLYMIFIICYFYDMESIHNSRVDENGEFILNEYGDIIEYRKKNWLFYVIKGVCSMVQLLFLIYELL